MTTAAALALAAMLIAPVAEWPQTGRQHPGHDIAADPAPTAARHLAPSEMAPAPGRWEVEDAPAYFSQRPDITDAPASGEPSADAARGDVPVARSRP